MTKSVLLVGVGGQGTILASKLLTLGLMEEGYDVKMSEIHGMSQRVGSVSSQVRYGDKAVSYTHLDVYKRQVIHWALQNLTTQLIPAYVWVQLSP